ncbi:MAG: tetratricopeptide repeat protein [Pseudomonadales bacterium]|jgi:tetratricopeptide (TPR) repeat protein|nr:tetratricopeptide repeat protein [Pseudomonadales bacterium]
MDGGMRSSMNVVALPVADDWSIAIACHRAGDTSGAIEHYERHLAQHPDDVDGWLTLASALRSSACTDAALVCCQRALRLAPHCAAAWTNLGMLWLVLGHHEQALRCHRNAMALDGRHIRPRLEYARTLGAIGNLEQAEAVLDECLIAEPERADLLFERACIRLRRGHQAQAWPDFDARLRLRPARVPELPLPRWCGERIGGKRLLLLAERGLADTLWATRFIPQLVRRGAEPTLVCPAALHPVLAALPVRLLASIDAGTAQREHDLQCALLSLPGLVEPRGRLIPEPAAVSVPAESRAWAAQRFADSGAALRIGVVCSNTGAERDTPPLRRLLGLAALPGVQLFSLQKQPVPGGAHAGHADGLLIDAGTRCRHLGDTAAILERMDLVIATDGVVARLAAAMEKPALILLPYSAHWIYGRWADTTPWYPTLRLLRQPDPGDWKPVIDELLRLVTTWACVREGRSSPVVSPVVAARGGLG